jgi:hypothetical protein
MKYIRTESEIYSLDDLYVCEELNGKPYATKNGGWCIYRDSIIKEAETIEELCDMFVGYIEINGNKEDLSIKMSDDLNDFNAIDRFMFVKEGELYGAIWTEWGLKYVAKMNENGELVLL